MAKIRDDEINEIAEILQQSKLVRTLPKESLLELAPFLEKITLQAGEVLITQGQPSKCVYLLIKGHLVTLLNKPNEKLEILGYINEFEFVGELGALTGEPHSLTVQALSNSELLSMPCAVFMDLLTKHHEIATEISHLVTKRSITTIRSITKDKKLSQQFSLILPVMSEASLQAFKKNLVSNVDGKNVRLIFNGGVTEAQLITFFNEALTENKSVIILMEAYSLPLLKTLLHYSPHFYLALHEGEKIPNQAIIKEALESVKVQIYVRLELILLHPDFINQIVNTRTYLQLGAFTLHHHVLLNNQADYQRLIRFMTGKAYGLVLGGGAVRGLTHLGIIRAILEKGITIDAIGGTSVGSGIAACYAMTQNETLTENLVQEIKYYSLQSVKLTQLTWPVISLYSAKALTFILQETFKSICIEDLRIPYFAVSANLTRHEETIHKAGLVWEATRSSGSIPGLLPPVVYNGDLLVDGGLLNNLPVDIMREMIGTKNKIIAASLSKPNTNAASYHFPPTLTLTKTLLSRMGLSNREYVFPSFLQTFLEALLLGSSATELKNYLSADISIRPDIGMYDMLSVKPEQEEELINIGYHEARMTLHRYFNEMSFGNKPD